MDHATRDNATEPTKIDADSGIALMEEPSARGCASGCWPAVDTTDGSGEVTTDSESAHRSTSAITASPHISLDSEETGAISVGSGSSTKRNVSPALSLPFCSQNIANMEPFTPSRSATTDPDFQGPGVEEDRAEQLKSLAMAIRPVSIATRIIQPTPQRPTPMPEAVELVSPAAPTPRLQAPALIVEQSSENDELSIRAQARLELQALFLRSFAESSVPNQGLRPPGPLKKRRRKRTPWFFSPSRRRSASPEEDSILLRRRHSSGFYFNPGMRIERPDSPEFYHRECNDARCQCPSAVWDQPVNQSSQDPTSFNCDAARDSEAPRPSARGLSTVRDSCSPRIQTHDYAYGPRSVDNAVASTSTDIDRPVFQDESAAVQQHRGDTIISQVPGLDPWQKQTPASMYFYPSLCLSDSGTGKEEGQKAYRLRPKPHHQRSRSCYIPATAGIPEADGLSEQHLSSDHPTSLHEHHGPNERPVYQVTETPIPPKLNIRRRIILDDPAYVKKVDMVADLTAGQRKTRSCWLSNRVGLMLKGIMTKLGRAI